MPKPPFAQASNAKPSTKSALLDSTKMPSAAPPPPRHQQYRADPGLPRRPAAGPAVTPRPGARRRTPHRHDSNGERDDGGGDEGDGLPKRDHHAFRGVPPPPTFDLDELADSTLLSELEAAAILRLSTNTLAAWRLREDQRRDHRLAWTTLPNGHIRYQVSALRAYLALGPRKKKPKPQDVAPPPATSRRRPAGRPRAKPDDPLPALGEQSS